MPNIKVLSVKQPWAWAIIAGFKTCENRTWGTNYRGPLLIHAGKSAGEIRTVRRLEKQSKEGVPIVDYDGTSHVMPPADELKRWSGAIVGVAYVAGCLDERGAKRAKLTFVEGPVCWHLERVSACKEPVPAKGMLNLFSLPDALVGAVKEALGDRWPEEWR